MENEELQEYLSDIWRTAYKVKDNADRLWNAFIDLQEQISVDYYAAKNLKQKIKTEVKDAVEYADKLAKLCRELNDLLNGDDNGES